MESSRKKGAPTEVTIERAEKGGFIVTHRFDNSMCGPSYATPEKFAFSDHAMMLAHVGKHTGGKVREVEPPKNDSVPVGAQAHKG
jgi:hypothetical protein